MNDFNFVDREVWELGLDSPAIQQSIIKAMSKASGYYSIPTGDITTSVFSGEDSPLKDKMIQALSIAMDMKLKDIATMLNVVRHSIILKEVQEKPLAEYEQTLKDIDIVSLAVFTLIKYVASTQGARQNAD